jgi:hypothetical protein
MQTASHRASAVAVLLTVIAAAPAARAASIGYVETLNGAISSAVDYNSARGTNSLASSGNTYEVTLPGLGNGRHSNVQVNAVNTLGQGQYCTSDGWSSPNGIDVGGSPVLADFALLYQARSRPPARGSIAFLWANRPTAASYTPAPAFNFNSTGKFNTIKRTKTGVYFAFLPGLTRTGGNPQVTAYSGTLARCEVTGWFQNRLGTTVGVYCVNSAGVAADELFSLSYTIGTNMAEGPAATSLGAYAWANNPTAANYVPSLRFQFDTVSAGPLTAQRVVGVLPFYTPTVPNPNNILLSNILGMVTANGLRGEYCNQFGGINVPPGEFYLSAICFDNKGRLVDTKYTGTFITTHCALGRFGSPARTGRRARPRPWRKPPAAPGAGGRRHGGRERIRSSGSPREQRASA